MAKNPPPLNPEEVAAFTTAVGAVKPVKRKARVEAVKPVIPANAGIQPVRRKLDSRLRGNDSELEISNTHRVDSNLARKLKRGEIRIEARLDLHGLTQEQAFQKLLLFLERAITSDKRCVCVVTGKGSRIKDQGALSEASRPSAPAAARSAQTHLSDSSREGGVLKESLPNWLNLPQINPHILMFTHAQPNDGGTGAFYILLRKTH